MKHEYPREKSLNENVVIRRLRVCSRRTKGNMNRRKVRKWILKKGKQCSEMATGDGGSGGSAFVTEVQESIVLKLNGYIRLTTLCLAMVGTHFPLNTHELFEDKGAFIMKQTIRVTKK